MVKKVENCLLSVFPIGFKNYFNNSIHPNFRDVFVLFYHKIHQLNKCYESEQQQLYIINYQIVQLPKFPDILVSFNYTDFQLLEVSLIA